MLQIATWYITYETFFSFYMYLLSTTDTTLENTGGPRNYFRESVRSLNFAT